MNQIIVVTDETGEESAVRDQATIRVEDKEKDGNGSGNGNGGGNGDGTGIGSGNNDGSTMAASTSPKTGDTSPQRAVSGTDSAFVSFFPL